jgi:hypothetical protein
MTSYLGSLTLSTTAVRKLCVVEYFCEAKPHKRESSRPTEPPRQPLTEPYVTLSRHTALVIPIISN